MKKRILSLMLTAVLLISLLPMPVGAAAQTEEEQIESAVAKLITDYAKKVYRANADDDAFSAFFRHGFFGNGKKMVLNENSAMVSALFNACVLQDAVTHGITRGIMSMRSLEEPILFLTGGPGWHNYYYTYQYSAYRGDHKEPTSYMGQLLTAKDIYGDSRYSGPTNENDAVMELLVGTVNCDVTIREVGTGENKKIYDLEFHVWDEFNFSGDYSHIADKGYDTSKDDDLNNLGYLLTFVGLDEFYWEFFKTFRVELPVYCAHGSGENYHWSFHSDSGLISHEDDGFKKNQGAPIQVDLEDGTYYQYLLDESVYLRHDKPWVVEYEMSPIKRLSLSPLPTSSTIYPYILQHELSHLWVPYYEQVKRGENKTGHQWHYMGVEMGKNFKRSSAQPYHFRIENIIGEDGQNMPWVTVWDANGEIVFGPEALNDYWTSSDLDSTRVLTASDTDLMVGRDIIINYIGSQSNPLRQKEVEVWIWENGKDAPEVQGTYRAPTCDEQGGYLHRCHKCGCDYLKEPIPALGHSYGEYIPDNNPGCVEDATETRTCTRCGEKDSVAISDTALGHSFGEYVYDNNASCTADGTQTRKCTVCGEKDTVTAPNTATGHSYESIVTEPTYTEQGYTTYTCTVCGDSYKDDYIDVKKHSYVGVVTEPTCTAQGFTTYTCSECGDSYVDDYTDMIDHTPVIDPAVKPTCSEKGKTEGSHCGVCGYVIKKQALISTNDNHTMEESIVKMPTYDEPGQLAYICTGCGKTDYMEIPPLNKPLVNPFTDVTESDWFFEPVLWAVQENVTGGKTETTFVPNEGCTRAQVVTFLWAANGKPELTSENPFTDVADDAWYLKPVLWAVEKGITTGVTATEFGPDQTCTRAQIATFLYAAAGKPAVEGGSEFSDVADVDWFAKPIVWAKENDVTGGIGDGKFGPNDTCTRAQVVTFLKKVYSN